MEIRIMGESNAVLKELIDQICRLEGVVILVVKNGEEVLRIQKMVFDAISEPEELTSPLLGGGCVMLDDTLIVDIVPSDVSIERLHGFDYNHAAFYAWNGPLHNFIVNRNNIETTLIVEVADGR